MFGREKGTSLIQLCRKLECFYRMALFVNIRLGWKWLEGTNTLAKEVSGREKVTSLIKRCSKLMCFYGLVLFINIRLGWK